MSVLNRESLPEGNVAGWFRLGVCDKGEGGWADRKVDGGFERPWPQQFFLVLRGLYRFQRGNREFIPASRREGRLHAKAT